MLDYSCAGYLCCWYLEYVTENTCFDMPKSSLTSSTEQSKTEPRNCDCFDWILLGFNYLGIYHQELHVCLWCAASVLICCS